MAAFDDPTFREPARQGLRGPRCPCRLLAAGALAAAVFVMRATAPGRFSSRPAATGRRPGWRASTSSATLFPGLPGQRSAGRPRRPDRDRSPGATDPSNIGGGMEFFAIAGAVIGGTPLKGGQLPVLGTLVGILILAVIGTAFNMLLIPFAWALRSCRRASS